jgi:hypothetical protein
VSTFLLAMAAHVRVHNAHHVGEQFAEHCLAVFVVDLLGWRRLVLLMMVGIPIWK